VGTRRVGTARKKGRTFSKRKGRHGGEKKGEWDGGSKEGMGEGPWGPEWERKGRVFGKKVRQGEDRSKTGKRKIHEEGAFSRKRGGSEFPPAREGRPGRGDGKLVRKRGKGRLAKRGRPGGEGKGFKDWSKKEKRGEVPHKPGTLQKREEKKGVKKKKKARQKGGAGSGIFRGGRGKQLKRGITWEIRMIRGKEEFFS